MRKQVMIVAMMAVVLIGSQAPGWAADDAKAKTEAEAKARVDADIKAVSAQLMSGDPQKVPEAIVVIQRLIAKDPKVFISALTTRWNTPLFFAKRYDDIASLTQNSAILALSINLPSADTIVEALLQMRVRALVVAGRGDEALAAAKSFYNVVTMRNTSVAIDPVAQALTAAHKDQPGLGKKFRLQQIESAGTNATVEAAAKMPSMLADVKVDAKPYCRADEC